MNALGTSLASGQLLSSIFLLSQIKQQVFIADCCRRNRLEEKRILDVYRKRDERVKNGEGFFNFENPAQLFRTYERYWATLRLLSSHGFTPLSDQRILDVGCGDGTMLRQFLQWGAAPANLAGIDLRSQAVTHAKQLNPDLDIRCGSATELPWADESFDLVCFHTVFTSILDLSMKEKIAKEVERVLRLGGAVLWYDFMYNNPNNPDVRGITAKEIHKLFAGFDIHLQRITLAPPIARRLPDWGLPVLYPLLSLIPLLRTHYLGFFVKI